ncbi:MAG TPA: hypothetical protein VGG67_05745 [Steroidobacteraceae bacterium]|jgi:hypothetical protein
MMSADDALAFIEERGAVLVAGKGPAPRLVEAILGEPIKGSWWAHPRSRGIFAVLRALEESRDLLLCCRLIDRKVTLVHRRLWPALVKLERRFTRQQLARIHQEHTPSGKHVTRNVDFPAWVPEIVRTEASALSEHEAERLLAPLVLPDAAVRALRPRASSARRTKRGKAD